jgi:hypothetical protein
LDWGSACNQVAGEAVERSLTVHAERAGRDREVGPAGQVGDPGLAEQLGLDSA